MTAERSELDLSIPTPAERAARLYDEFEEVLRREADALEKIDVPQLDELHARKGALRRKLEEANEAVLRSNTEGDNQDGSPPILPGLRRRLRRLVALQRENEQLARRMKDRVEAQLSALAERRAVAQGYNQTTKVSAQHVDILR
jgi:hypothetical protein